MAMLAGVRSAFQSMLAQFDPARIEESEGRARRLPLGGRPRHWERYEEQFDALTRDPDECFRRLFGDEFARAYEQQLAHLKSPLGRRPAAIVDRVAAVAVSAPPAAGRRTQNS